MDDNILNGDVLDNVGSNLLLDENILHDVSNLGDDSSDSQNLITSVGVDVPATDYSPILNQISYTLTIILFVLLWQYFERKIKAFCHNIAGRSNNE